MGRRPRAVGAQERPARACPGPGRGLPDPRGPGPALPPLGRPQPAALRPGVRRPRGFDRPILHGLCTYGFTGRALLHTVCDSDPARFRSMEGRFSAPVLPGEALTVSMWVDGDEACFQTTGGDGRVVLDGGRCTFTA
ncbi:MAG: MaoC/PaaZ C-terminal domain-containing protein [Acidimicrobiales bacterium]